eukprot:COSAG01_NODE_21040_length_921_cov_1.086375_1_plen_237_part_00
MGGDDDDGEAPSFETQEGSSKDLFQWPIDFPPQSDIGSELARKQAFRLPEILCRQTPPTQNHRSLCVCLSHSTLRTPPTAVPANARSQRPGRMAETSPTAGRELLTVTSPWDGDDDELHPELTASLAEIAAVSSSLRTSASRLLERWGCSDGGGAAGEEATGVPTAVEAPTGGGAPYAPVPCVCGCGGGRGKQRPSRWRWRRRRQQQQQQQLRRAAGQGWRTRGDTTVRACAQPAE